MLDAGREVVAWIRQAEEGRVLAAGGLVPSER
jgi:hypothetical protein